MSEAKILNVGDLSWDHWSKNARISVEIKDPARKLGSQLCGFRIERLQPGKQSSPLHRHHLQEELFLILKGAGTLRHGTQEAPVKAGDFILYLAGDPDPHTFINTGDEPLEFIATGNRSSYEVCEYPEEGTVFVEALNKTVPNKEVEGTRAATEAWYKAGQEAKK
jgi:uncharacterized cupin superfamily protein